MAIEAELNNLRPEKWDESFEKRRIYLPLE